MNNVKNLELSKKKLVALLLAGSFVLPLASCGAKGDIIPEPTMQSLMTIDEVKDSTLIDELIEDDNFDYAGGQTLLEAADMLDRYISIMDKVSEVNLDGVDQLSDLTSQEYDQALKLNDEQIDKLLEAAKNKKSDLKSLDERLTALKKLAYLKKHCSLWIEENGKNVSMQMMKMAVKAAVGSELNVPVEQCDFISFPSADKVVDENEKDYTLIVGDREYQISPNARALVDTLDCIAELDTTALDSIKDTTLYRKSLDCAKKTIASGASLKNGIIEVQNDQDYIHKNYLIRR